MHRCCGEHDITRGAEQSLREIWQGLPAALLLLRCRRVEHNKRVAKEVRVRSFALAHVEWRPASIANATQHSPCAVWRKRKLRVSFMVTAALSV